MAPPKSDQNDLPERLAIAETTQKILVQSLVDFRAENKLDHTTIVVVQGQIFELLRKLPCGDQAKDAAVLEQKVKAQGTWIRILWGLFVAFVVAATGWALSQPHGAKP